MYIGLNNFCDNQLALVFSSDYKSATNITQMSSNL